MQERTAAAGGDLLPSVVGRGVPSIVVQVASEIHRDAAAEHRALQIVEIALALRRIVLRVACLVDPVRLGDADDELGVIGDLLLLHELTKVLELRLVDVGVELHVQSDQPPVVRQLDREVAERLPGLPPADPPAVLAAEEPRECDEAVVPVVVPWNGEHLVVRAVHARQRRAIRRGEPAVVLVARRSWVHLVAAEHQQLPALRRESLALVRQLELRLRERVRDGVRRVPAVARIGDVVDPDLVAALVVARGDERVHHRVEHAAVRAAAEHRGDDDLQSGAHELRRIEPRDHRRALGRGRHFLLPRLLLC